MKDKSLGGDTWTNRFSKTTKHPENKKKYKQIPKKCSMCGSTKNVELHDKNVKKSHTVKRKSLIALCHRCHRKLHDANMTLDQLRSWVRSKKSKKSKGSLDNVTTLVSQARLIETPEHPEMLRAIASECHNADLLFTEFILCHIGTNGNKDTFINEELIPAASTPQKKPIDWEHTINNVGVVYESQYIKHEDSPSKSDLENKADYIKCEGAIWKFKFPRETREILQRHEDGKLFFSMEVYFQEAECSVCGEKFQKTVDYCEHLINRFAAGSETHRILHGLNFGGAAITKNPADRDAVGFAKANKIITLDSIIQIGKIKQFDLKDYVQFFKLIDID